MTKLSWDNVGERFFETGVDRGVLYLKGQPGVAWSGLVNVTESPTGGEPTPYYIDGQKHYNYTSPEEFEATIEAFTYPDEFELCMGVEFEDEGIGFTQQLRSDFGLAYRTLIGNEVLGASAAYKLHLVYNATVSPTTRSNGSVNETPDPMLMNWGITTLNETISDRRPTAHLVIDSRKTVRSLMRRIEAMLYGSGSEPPRLPSAQELSIYFDTYIPVGYAERPYGQGPYGGTA